MKKAFVILLILIASQTTASAGSLDVVVKLATGAAAVFASANAAEAATVYRQKDSVISQLKARGLDPKDGAIFQVYFAIDPNAAGRWFLSPNVYALVQIEGQGDYVPAFIAKGYRGQEVSLIVYAHQVRPGGRILVHILDDKEFWNTTWNSLLQTEVQFTVAGATLTPLAKIQFDAQGGLRLINKDITFQPPGYMATADFIVPQAEEDGTWLADGTLFNSEKNQVGKLQFRQVWRVDPKMLDDLPLQTWRIVFWGGLALVLAIIFASQFKAKRQIA